jgi:hypothetical protein
MLLPERGATSVRALDTADHVKHVANIVATAFTATARMGASGSSTVRGFR